MGISLIAKFSTRQTGHYRFFYAIRHQWLRATGTTRRRSHMAKKRKLNANQENIIIQARVDATLFERLEDWRRSQEKIPARSVAMCRLIERALAAETATA
jgi:hypothetical protein